MSGGYACQCAESKKKVTDRRWRVTQRQCNHSAFSGYAYTSSEYSALKCLECRAVWRTKAAYVGLVPDMKKYKTG